MKRSDALDILGLSGSESVDVLKATYRRRAFDTHPDRGGSAAEFLKVQAAYEMLSANPRSDYADNDGLAEVLAERLNEVHNAFALIEEEADQYCQAVFEGFHKALLETINAYQSSEQLKVHAQVDITYLWTRVAERISGFLETKIGAIADRQDKWLREYLEPSLVAARDLNPARWFETPTSSVERYYLPWLACSSPFTSEVYGRASLPQHAFLHLCHTELTRGNSSQSD